MKMKQRLHSAQSLELITLDLVENVRFTPSYAKAKNERPHDENESDDREAETDGGKFLSPKVKLDEASFQKVLKNKIKLKDKKQVTFVYLVFFQKPNMYYLET